MRPAQGKHLGAETPGQRHPHGSDLWLETLGPQALVPDLSERGCHSQHNGGVWGSEVDIDAHLSSRATGTLYLQQGQALGICS